MKGRETKGITLIALVITIIVLLILAGVTIATLTGENGILTKATKAKKMTAEEEAKEKVTLMLLDWRMENTTNKVSLDDYLMKDEYKEARNTFEVTNVNPKDSNDCYLATVNVNEKNYYVTINAEDPNNPKIEGVSTTSSKIQIKLEDKTDKYVFANTEGEYVKVRITVEGDAIQEIEEPKNAEKIEEGIYKIPVQGQEYTFTIKTKNGERKTKSIKIDKVLSAPKITAKAGAKSITVNVTNEYPSDANVKYKYTIGTDTSSGTTDRTYTKAGLTPGTQYTIKVLAYLNDDEKTGITTEIKCTPKDLEKPSIEISNVNTTSFKINVTNALDDSDVVYEYYINGAKQNNTATNLKTYDATGLTEATLYTVYVKAVLGSESTMSDECGVYLKSNNNYNYIPQCSLAHLSYLHSIYMPGARILASDAFPQDNAWCTDSGKYGEHWYMVELDEPAKYTRYSVSCIPQNPGEAYKYYLQGSTDGSNWVNLENEAHTAAGGEFTYEFVNQNVYKYYRLFFTQGGWTWGASGGITFSGLYFQ